MPNYFPLVALLMAFESGTLRGELLTLYWILVGVVDLLLVSIGMLGLFMALGVCWNWELVLKLLPLSPYSYCALI